MYEAIRNLKSLGEFETFPEAFKAIYDSIKKNPPITWMELASVTWIKNEISLLPISFYDARDLMCRQGYLVEGKWVD